MLLAGLGSSETLLLGFALSKFSSDLSVPICDLISSPDKNAGHIIIVFPNDLILI